MNFMIAVFITALAVFAVPFRVALAYSIETHAYLADETFSFYKNHFDDAQISEELRGYFIDGARREDDGIRPLNHFYDPVYDRGFTEPILGTWEKSKDWADDSASQNNLKYKVPATIASVLSAVEKGKISEISFETDFTWKKAIRYWVNGEKEKAMFTL